MGGSQAVGDAGDDLAPPAAGNKRRRCAACYREAGERKLAQKVKRVVTSCCQCGKAFCLPHLQLYCDGCNVGGAAAPFPQPQVDQTVERQQLEIQQLRQQLQAAMNVVGSLSYPLIFSFSVPQSLLSKTKFSGSGLKTCWNCWIRIPYNEFGSATLTTGSSSRSRRAISLRNEI